MTEFIITASVCRGNTHFSGFDGWSTSEMYQGTTNRLIIVINNSLVTRLRRWRVTSEIIEAFSNVKIRFNRLPFAKVITKLNAKFAIQIFVAFIKF